MRSYNIWTIMWDHLFLDMCTAKALISLHISHDTACHKKPWITDYPQRASEESYQTAWPQGYKTFSCLTQLSMKFHLVIKIKISTIKTFFMLNSAEHAQMSWAWKKFSKIVSILRFIRKLNFMLSWVEHEKSFITSWPECTCCLNLHQTHMPSRTWPHTAAGEIIVFLKK